MFNKRANALSNRCIQFSYAISATSVGVQDSNNSFGLAFNFQNGRVSVSEESLAYDATNLIGDVGGFLGLFLGLSILGIYRDLARVVGSAGDKCRKEDLLC